LKVSDRDNSQLLCHAESVETPKMEVTHSQHNYELVLIRHGESEWNSLNLFTGWKDTGLTGRGITEARAAGQLLRHDGFTFDVAFTSVLRRGIETLWLMLKEMDLMWIPEHKSWRLNERHYGKLTGLDKIEAVKQFGQVQVQQWRRGFDVRPPLVDCDSADYPKLDPRYKDLTNEEIPRGESLKDVILRVLPYFESAIVPELRAGKKVLIVGHGNSLRALIKHLEKLPDEEIVKVNLPTAVPRVYELDDNLRVTSKHFHGDPDEIEKKIGVVAGQARWPSRSAGRPE
jgi:2,3-bisphosphoglycerate-dependent phosphoglycerate mutase